jgi:hypothetical protein
MRRALNESPIVQAALIGVLVIGVAVLLLTRMSSGSDSSTDTAGAPAPAADPAAAAPAADPAAAPAAAAQANAATPAPSTPVGAPDLFQAGKGLPEDVVKAYNDNKTVVLLILREHPQGCYSRAKLVSKRCGGIDDGQVATIVRVIDKLRVRPNTALFITHAANVADYSRITTGVDLDRVPALVVLSPKRLNDGGLPRATVSYGFRGPGSIVQAIEDAEYKGKTDLPYYPH